MTLVCGCLQRLEEVVRTLVAGLIGSYKLPIISIKMNSGPLEGQKSFLTNDLSHQLLPVGLMLLCNMPREQPHTRQPSHPGTQQKDIAPHLGHGLCSSYSCI